VIRRWFPIALLGLIAAVFVAAFLTMAVIRSRQGHSGQVYPSEIEALAVHSAPVDPLADARTRGRATYQHYCRICHGESGAGNGFNSSNLENLERPPRPPRDFTSRQFWQQTTDERVYYAVAQGGRSVGKSVLMPAWGDTLTERQLRDVIVFIHAFAAPPQATP
jgi:cytochrome c oxidase cbb3-type subunit 3